MDWYTWGPPLAVLIVSALAGVILATRARSASLVSDPREVLRARKATLMEQLRTLERERQKLDAGDYDRQKAALVAEAAGVLRQLEAPEVVEPPRAPPPATGVRALWALGSALFIGVAAFVMVSATAPRQDDMGAAPASAPDPDSRRAIAEAALAENPHDIGVLNYLSHDAIMRQDIQAAMRYVDQARNVSPDDAEVRTHLAAMQIFVGMFDRANEGLDAVLADSPDFPEALLWKAVALIQLGQVDAAKTLLERARDTAKTPEEQVAAARMLQQLSGAAPVAAAQPPPNHPPVASAAPAVTGTISAPEGAPEGRLFVFVRSSPEERGPPLAAKKFDTWTLPVDFTLGAADLIRGGDWPEEVYIKARIATAQNPMIRAPEDWESEMMGPVKAGAEGLALKLAAP